VDGRPHQVLRLTVERNAELAKLGAEAALSVEEVEAQVAKSLALYAALDFQPLAAFFGGVVAQEVVKFTGKYQPLTQWFHLDAFEALPAERPAPDDTAPRGSRYDDLVAMYGAKFMAEKVADARTFVVGCGALGCEYLKNFALLGVGTGPRGQIVVTDNDRIEVSNLNRQFLFREKNVGQPKSVAASQAALRMNGALKIEAKEELVAVTTENVFVDSFWEGLDFVTNALDNVKARLYVDSRCVRVCVSCYRYRIYLSILPSRSSSLTHAILPSLPSPPDQQLRLLRQAAPRVGHAGHQVQRAGDHPAPYRLVRRRAQGRHRRGTNERTNKRRRR